MSDDVDVAPATEIADSQTPAPSPDETASPGEGQVTEQVEQPKTFTQADIDKAVRDRVAREQRKYERRIGQLEAKVNAPPVQEVPKPVEPKLEQFKDWDAYNAAMVDFRVDQKLAAREALSANQQAIQTRAQREAELQRAHIARVDAAKDRYEDFDDVVEPILSINVPGYIVELVGESEKSADLLYKLGENPKEYLRIAKLPPVAAARELAKLESSIAEPEKPTSNAPPPVPKIVGKSSAPLDYPDARRQSTEEWMRAREAQIKAQRRR
jgi:hypothetical protein